SRPRPGLALPRPAGRWCGWPLRRSLLRPPPRGPPPGRESISGRCAPLHDRRRSSLESCWLQLPCADRDRRRLLDSIANNNNTFSAKSPARLHGTSPATDDAAGRRWRSPQDNPKPPAPPPIAYTISHARECRYRWFSSESTLWRRGERRVRHPQEPVHGVVHRAPAAVHGAVRALCGPVRHHPALPGFCRSFHARRNRPPAADVLLLLPAPDRHHRGLRRHGRFPRLALPRAGAAPGPFPLALVAGAAADRGCGRAVHLFAAVPPRPSRRGPAPAAVFPLTPALRGAAGVPSRGFGGPVTRTSHRPTASLAIY